MGDHELGIEPQDLAEVEEVRQKVMAEVAALSQRIWNGIEDDEFSRSDYAQQQGVSYDKAKGDLEALVRLNMLTKRQTKYGGHRTTVYRKKVDDGE